MSTFFWFLVLFVLCLEGRNDDSNDRQRKGRGYRKYMGKANQNGKRDPNSPHGKEYLNLNPEDRNKRTGYHELDCKTGDEYLYEYDNGVIDEWENKQKNDQSKCGGKKRGKHGKEDDNKNVNDDSIRRLVIQGPDNRFENFGAPPTSTLSEYVGLLSFSGGWCTATLIDWTWIITAAHCVHEGSGGNWYSNFVFYPRRTSRWSPSGISIDYLVAFTGWIEYSDVDYDMGWLRLSYNPYLGHACWGWSNLITTSTFIYIWGYPQDKTYGSMWDTYDYLFSVQNLYFQTDESDTAGGVSGAPIHSYGSHHTWSPYEWCIDATHYGYWGGYNRHTRITYSKFNAICPWVDSC